MRSLARHVPLIGVMAVLVVGDCFKIRF